MDYALEFEEPSLLTLGICYELRPRFSGGAYHPVLKRCDEFKKAPLAQALAVRTSLAERLLQLDDIVIEKVQSLKNRGLASPYLKSFVVARINPIRFKPKGSSVPSVAECLETMILSAQKFNLDRIKAEDLTRAGGPSEPSE